MILKRSVNIYNGFTLIELIIVIAITAILVAVSLPNYLSARERARDAKRKEEVKQMQTALRMYYSDYGSFPTAATTCGTGKTNYIMGCGENGTTCCPCNTTTDFASGTSCDVIYMKKFPSEFGNSRAFYYYSSLTDYCLKIDLENAADSDIANSQNRCSTICTSLGGGTSVFKTNTFAACSE